jgi:NADPH-dependent 2,4-dienoyl-CoA reductase/sulfur reductase-like enzyme
LTHIASFMQKHVVIIGNGITGITTARHLRKNSDCRITVISSESEYFFSRTALMYVYMGHIKVEHTQPYEPWFWKKNRIDLVHDHVDSIDPQTSSIHLKKGGKMAFDQLVIATGSKPNFFNWPGQDSKGVQGLYSLQDLENLEKNTHAYNAKASERRVKRAVIVGGGLIGVELAEMLLTRGIEVTFLIRENKFWGSVLPKEEASLVSKHMVKHHIDMRFSSEMKEILPDDQGRVRAIVTTSGEEIECQLVGVTTGVSPNVSLLKNSGIEVKRGVLVDAYLETNIPGIFAAGDCAEFREAPAGRRNIEQVWYTGRMMGETLAKTLSGAKTQYTPGHWFNSAKFFDIEYQTYGWVGANLSENEDHFYWEHPGGEKCVKIVYHRQSMKFIGINTFGIRMRHECFDKWLNEKRTVDYIISHLSEANFDPEFYINYGPAIQMEFEKQIKISAQ